MVEPLRHRQTKGAATDMFYLTPPRHISTLPFPDVVARNRDVQFAPMSGHRQRDRLRPKSAKCGGPSSPSVAHHALWRRKARDIGELAFENRSERNAADEFQNPL
jgi:hypothetical protein